jgi:hypothetical protein
VKICNATCLVIPPLLCVRANIIERKKNMTTSSAPPHTVAPPHSSISGADVASQTPLADSWPDDERREDIETATRQHVVFETAMAVLAIIGAIVIACTIAIMSVMNDNDNNDECMTWRRRLETYASLHTP